MMDRLPVLDDLRLMRYPPRGPDRYASLAVAVVLVVAAVSLSLSIGASQTVVVQRTDVTPASQNCVISPANQFVRLKPLSAQEWTNLFGDGARVSILGHIWFDNTDAAFRLNFYKEFEQTQNKCRPANAGVSTLVRCDVVRTRSPSDNETIGYVQFGDAVQFSKIDWYNSPSTADIEIDFVEQGLGKINNITDMRIGMTSLYSRLAGPVPIISTVQMRPKLYLDVANTSALHPYVGKAFQKVAMTMSLPREYLSYTLEQQSFVGLCQESVSLTYAERVGIISGYMSIVYGVSVFLSNRVLRWKYPRPAASTSYALMDSSEP